MPPPTDPNIELLIEASEKLGPLLDDLVLVGGCAAGLLVTDPAASPIRATEDVDLLVEATTYVEYHRFGELLIQRGFSLEGGQGDPLCRFHHEELVVDVMPLDPTVLGFSNRWYPEVMVNRSEHRLPNGRRLFHVDAPHFVATKLDAFRSRGNGDYLVSKDLEDIVIVTDGRESIADEIATSSTALRDHVREGVQELLEAEHFVEAVPGYFAGEADLEQRVRQLLARLRAIAGR